MLPPVIGPITPYKRICGCAFILLAVAVAPNLHFALQLRYSSGVADAAIWPLFGVYAGILFVPRLRRVSTRASYVVLASTALLTSLFLGFAAPIKQAVAIGVGFYADPLPWSSAGILSASTTYQDPVGKYALEVPAGWIEQPGPVPGTSEFLRHADTTTSAARLRPTCDFVDEPLAVRVSGLLRDHPELQRSCGRWQAMDACLLEDRASTLRWEWLGHDTAHGLHIRLMFELFDETQKAEALAIIHSVRLAK